MSTTKKDKGKLIRHMDVTRGLPKLIKKPEATKKQKPKK